jgi:hypothetical protein
VSLCVFRAPLQLLVSGLRKVGEGEGVALIRMIPRLPGLRMHSPVLRFTAGPEMTYRSTEGGQMLLFFLFGCRTALRLGTAMIIVSIAMNIRRSHF